MKNKTKNIQVSPELESASKIARHYGFSKFSDFEVEKEDIKFAKKFHESHLKVLHPFYEKSDRFGGFLEEKISLVRHFTDKKLQNIQVPMMGYYEAPLKGNPHIKRISEDKTFNLEILGASKSIAEAMIIEASYVILKDRYKGEDLRLEINSIGDKDSLSKFVRELGIFLKKESSNIPKKIRDVIKKDPWKLFDFDDEKIKEIQERAPKSMTFLSESSRSHFKEVLEYLESLEIPYVINHSLIGSRSYCSDTIFEIIGTKNGVERVLALGERYNTLAKRGLGKKDLPAIGVALLIHPHFFNKKATKEKNIAPKFFFIQIGFEAKLQSLKVMETLRQANIPVYQSLSKDKLSVQLTNAEKMNIPYIIMIGQKEAIEHSVVIRKMSTMSQETIPLIDLPKYLKKLK